MRSAARRAALRNRARRGASVRARLAARAGAEQVGELDLGDARARFAYAFAQECEIVLGGSGAHDDYLTLLLRSGVLAGLCRFSLFLWGVPWSDSGVTVAGQRLCISPSAEQRLSWAAEFLRALPARAPLLLLTPDATAAALLVARVLAPGEARFAWRRLTLSGLALELALPELARARRVPLKALASEALIARVVHELGAEQALGRYADIAEQPGFVRALAKTLGELRLAGTDAASVAEHAPELGQVLERYERALGELLLADSAEVYAAAVRALGQRDAASTQRGPTRLRSFLRIDVPLLALDVPLTHAAEAELVQALCRARGKELASAVTVARGDERSEAHFRVAFGQAAEVVRLEPRDARELSRLQARLFVPGSVRERSEANEKGSVRIVSSPGEAREAVEVARAVLDAAAAGVPFDRMAIALRAVEGYRAVVEEALTRAEIPAHFAEGVRRPRAEGRAFLALLACARDGLSARAFAEYLSFGVLPRAREGDAPLVSPRKWERLLVEAAVIGGRARWQRRLAGLKRELEDERALLDAEDPRRERLSEECARLEALAAFALPLLELLSGLTECETWDALLPKLAELARASLHEPDDVLALLAELTPLGPVAVGSLASVCRVLASRLSSVVVPSAGHGAGKLFVGAIDDLRGRAFERVFVLGLAERVFPPRISEDALLPDALRSALSADLWLTEERVARERLLLRIAVGAARELCTLSFPRFDLVHGRPRVPSFYGLEVLQAIDGVLPAFDELTRRADHGAAARMGFPAPRAARDAIDDAEFDLAMLERLLRAPPAERRGAARYLLDANVHLARALRFRARRWELTKFSPADGFVASDERGRALLSAHRLSARPYSATALSELTRCPYRFYLRAIVGLAERTEVAAQDELDARQRGVLFHRVQRALLSELQERGELPRGEQDLERARVRLREVFERFAARARDDYAPSIEGVFEAGLRAVLRDLTEWLERLAREHDWQPQHFELAFGMRGLEHDAASVGEAVTLANGLRLRGAIDLVERRANGSVRATDYKTGAAPDKLGIVSGGRVLQPVLYALALEQLFPGAQVEAGRLYYCTAQGEYKSHEVPLDASARALAGEFATQLDALLAQGFFPADPARQPEDRERYECEHCAYRVVCGPYESERVGQVKGRDFDRLAPVQRVRNLP